MKIEVNQNGEVFLKDVFNGVVLTTEEGNSLGICMRDDTFELSVMPLRAGPKWYRIDMSSADVYGLSK